MRDGVPDGWELRRLGSIVGVRKERFEPRGSNSLPYVALEHIEQGAPRLRGWFTSDIATSTKTLFKIGDVLFGKLRPNLRKVAPAPFDGVASTDILPLYARKGLHPGFLLQLCQWRSLQDQVIATAIGTKMPRTSWRELSRVEITLPPLPEQRKIAEILSSVDDAIERTEAVIEQVRRVKRGLAQQLLTRGLPGRHTHFQQTEVGEIPACWQVVRLGECIARGPTNGVYRPLSEYGAGAPIVRIDDFEAGEFLRLDGFKRLRLPADEVQRYALRPREVLINRVNSLPHLGKCALVPDLPEPTVYESNMMRLATKEGLLLPEFLVLWLCSSSAIRQIQARAKRAVAQASIDQDDVKTLLLPLPPPEEQATIVQTVDRVDSRIKHDQNVLEALRATKRNLMHVLLTGQVRVRVGHSGGR